MFVPLSGVHPPPLLSCVSIPTQRNSAKYFEQFCQKFCAQCQLRTLHRCVRLRPCVRSVQLASKSTNLRPGTQKTFGRKNTVTSVAKQAKTAFLSTWANGGKVADRRDRTHNLSLRKHCTNHCTRDPTQDNHTNSSLSLVHCQSFSFTCFGIKFLSFYVLDRRCNGIPGRDASNPGPRNYPPAQ